MNNGWVYRCWVEAWLDWSTMQKSLLPLPLILLPLLLNHLSLLILLTLLLPCLLTQEEDLQDQSQSLQWGPAPRSAPSHCMQTCPWAGLNLPPVTGPDLGQARESAPRPAPGAPGLDAFLISTMFLNLTLSYYPVTMVTLAVLD